MGRRDDDENAPWLAEAVARPRTDVSKRSLFWTVLVLLSLATVAAVGLILLLSKKDSGSTQGYMNAEQAPLITAEPGPYKIPPLDPKGLAVEGQDQTIYAAGEGIDQGSVIDPNAGPEAPLPRPGTEPPGLPQDLLPEMATAPAVTPAPVAPAVPRTGPPPAAAVPKTAPPVAKIAPPAAKTAPPAATKAPPAATKAPPAAIKPAATASIPARKAGTVQLGAFSSLEKANAAWAGMASKPALAGFAKRILLVESDGKTLYRLRASGGDATETCRSLKAAGAPCTVVE
jgi:cell division septation protein DedD